MLGSQMRLPVSGLNGAPSLPLASPRHFGGGPGGGAPGGGDIEASIQSWRDNFLNKYHEQAREVSTFYSFIMRVIFSKSSPSRSDDCEISQKSSLMFCGFADIEMVQLQRLILSLII